mgnify:CR=1 FL=1
MFESQQKTLANFIEEHAKKSPYSYEELALLCGFKTSDMIYAFAHSEWKVPLDKVAPLAKALDCDKGKLFVLALKSWFSGELFNQIEECFGAVPENSAERSWIVALREIYNGDVPEMTVKTRRCLKILVGFSS